MLAIGPVHLREPRQTRGGGLEGVLAAHMGAQHEQLHLQRLVGLRRQREGVVDAAVARVQQLHVLELHPAAAPGREGEDAQPERVRRHLLDQGRVDALAHDVVVHPARLLLLHDQPLDPLVADPQHQVGDDGALGQGELVDPLHLPLGVVGEDLVRARASHPLVDAHVHGDLGQLQVLAAVVAHAGVHVTDAGGGQGGQQQGGEQDVSKVHGGAPFAGEGRRRLGQ